MRWCATEREKAQRVRFAKRAGMAFPVTALAKGSKASKGAKDCFTELRTAEALPPHQRFAPTRRSGHCRLTVATRQPGTRVTAASPSLRANQAPGSLPPRRRNAPERQSFDPRAPFAPFARTPLPPVVYKSAGAQPDGRRRNESPSHLKQKSL